MFIRPSERMQCSRHIHGAEPWRGAPRPRPRPRRGTLTACRRCQQRRPRYARPGPKGLGSDQAKSREHWTSVTGQVPTPLQRRPPDDDSAFLLVSPCCSGLGRSRRPMLQSAPSPAARSSAVCALRCKAVMIVQSTARTGRSVPIIGLFRRSKEP